MAMEMLGWGCSSQLQKRRWSKGRASSTESGRDIGEEAVLGSSTGHGGVYLCISMYTCREVRVPLQ